MLTSIKHKILIIFIIIGILPLTGFSIWEYYQSIERLRQRSFEQLKTVRQIKQTELERYFHKIQTETNLFAQSYFAIGAMKEFKKAFSDLNTSRVTPAYQEELKQRYREQFATIPEFQNNLAQRIEEIVPMNKRSLLLQYQYLTSTKAVFENLPYFDVHNKYHKSLSAFAKRYDIHDLFFIEDETGYIVYSVAKEIDFATSLLSGPFADTNLGKLYRKMRYSGLRNTTKMCDYERYLPSNYAPAAFIAAPIFDQKRKVGTLILQVPLHKINQITTGTKTWQEEGMGKSGETYIVGSDYKMRTDSRFIIESSKEYLDVIKASGTASPKEIALMEHYKTSVLFQTVDTAPVEKSMAGTSGTIVALDYRNIEVLSSYAPLEIDGMNWTLLAEIDTKEVFESVQKTALQSILILLFVILLIFFAFIFLARTIYRPIRALAKAATELGNGNFNTQVMVRNNDELGFLATTFNQTVANLKEGREEIISKNRLLNIRKNQLAEKSERLIILNNKISELNKSLDRKVKERTHKLVHQNKKLMEYADFNSHQLRAPLSTILGLLDVLKVSENKKDMDEYIHLLDVTTKELDIVIHKAQKLLESTEFDA